MASRYVVCLLRQLLTIDVTDVAGHLSKHFVLASKPLPGAIFELLTKSLSLSGL